MDDLEKRNLCSAIMKYINSKPYDALPDHVKALERFIPHNYEDTDDLCEAFIQFMEKIEDSSAVLGRLNWSWETSDERMNVTREMYEQYLFRTTSFYPTIALRDSQNGYLYYSFDKEAGPIYIENLVDLFGIPPFVELDDAFYRKQNFYRRVDPYVEINRLLHFVRPPPGCVIGSSLQETRYVSKDEDYGTCLRDHIIDLLLTRKFESQRPEKISEYAFYKACMELKT